MNKFGSVTKPLRWFMALLLVAFVAGCGGGGNGTIPAATLASIAVTSTNQSMSIAKGTTKQFTATGIYSDNTTKNLTSSVTWNSSATSVATLSYAAPFELATAGVAGTTTITASLGTVFSGPTTLTVTNATLASIAVTPTNPSIVKGTASQFIATGTYSDQTTQDLTSSVTWSESTSGVVATISNVAGSNGLAKAVAAGSTTIKAVDPVTSKQGIATLTVTAATLASIAVTPTNPSIAKGTTKQFTAMGTYSDTSTQNITSSVTWNSSATSVATLSYAAPFELATSVAAGTTTITANLGTVFSGPTTLTVTNATLASIAVTPTNPSIAPGTTKQFTATGLYSDTNTLDITSSVTWSESTSGVVATISNVAGSNGLASALATGQTTIKAVDPITQTEGTTTLTVAVPPLAAVPLGTAGNYTILAEAGITNSGTTTVVTGDIAVSPIDHTAITGFGTPLTLDGSSCFSTSTPTTLVTGNIYAADYSTANSCTSVPDTATLLTTAVNDMAATATTGYLDGAGRTAGTGTFFNAGTGGDIGGLILPPGVYTWGGNVTISLDLTLQGGANDVWIFQIPGTLAISPGKQVILSALAGTLPKAKNVFWVVEGATAVDVALDTTSHFEGIILAKTTIAMNTGASINGRLLSQTSVTLLANTVTPPAP